MQCATHPNIETELGCSKCGKPICTRCAVQTPVGMRCRECAGIRRIPTYNVGGTTLLRAAGAAVGAGIGIGVAWAFFNLVTYIFYGVLAGIGIGYVIGEIVSLSTNRRSGPPLQAAAVGGVILAYVTRVLVLLVATDWTITDVRRDGFGLIVALLASFIAAGRLR